MKTKLAALIEVRKITMLWFALIFGIIVLLGTLSIGSITVNEWLPLFTMVFGFYFGRSTALDNPKRDDK